MLLFSFGFCCGGFPLQKIGSGLFQSETVRRSIFFCNGALTGLAVVWVARCLVGTPAGAVLSASGLLVGRLFFPLKRWRQDDLRGAVTGSLLAISSALAAAFLCGWLFWYLITREAPLSSFMAALVLIPASLALHEGDIIFIFTAFLAWFFLHDSFNQLEKMARTGIISVIYKVPLLYLESRPLRVFLRAAVLGALVLAVLTTAILNRMVSSEAAPAGVFHRGSDGEPVVALTFDDGPHPLYTAQILDLLKEKEVRATFFVVGTHVRRCPDLARRIAAEGHEIGNHTYSHANLLRRDREKIYLEIARNNEIIKEITGVQPVFFRPPRGLYNRAVLEACFELDLQLILWSVSAEDWIEPSAGDIARRVIKHARPGAIILFHDSGDFLRSEGGVRSNTVQALGTIIDRLSAQGYRFVTVSKMLELDENENAPE
jgi:peptidoglycan/xylan/chitin deacetylase (PgdA/CDA1 family)